MNSCRICLMALGVLLVIMGQAEALVTISTMPHGGTSAPFGEPDSATYGQTVTVPLIDNQLNSFSFWLSDWQNPDFVDFAAYVMQWDGAKATGPVLWQSAPQSTTNNGGAGGFEMFTFNTGRLQLVSGQKYVLFISASEYFDSLTGQASFYTASVDYPEGNFVFMNNGSDFSMLTTNTWSDVYFGGCHNSDLAFEATFSSIPAPSAVLLGSIGISMFTWFRRHRIL